MQAYVLNRYGKADAMEIREFPTPAPGTGEIRIRVHAAGLNPIDYKTREGKARLLTRLNLPIVAGSELAGVVDSLGPGVEGFSEGDRVYARVDLLKLGAFAEYASVDQSLVAKMPEKADFVQAAGLPLAGTTALQALRNHLDVGPGTRLFISGGAGGVGTLAIQIATYLGAEVATTASEKGERLVRDLGAKQVVNYKEEDFSRVLHDYDAVLDLVGGDDLIKAFTILKPGGKVVSISGVPDADSMREDLDVGAMMASAFRLASAKVRRIARKNDAAYRFLFMRPSGEDLEFLAELVDKEALTATVDRVFPFDEIAEAFAYLEQGRAKGKVIVSVQQ